VGTLAKALAQAAGLKEELADLLETVGLWHDVGKSHRCFQGSIRMPGMRPERQDLAKAPKGAWDRKYLYRSDSNPEEYRPGFRHELASALALFSSLQDGDPTHAGLYPRSSEVFGAAVQWQPKREPASWEQRFSAWDAHHFNLLAYLVASHHGKVRLRLNATSKDQEYRDADGLGLPIQGVRDRDQLPALAAPDGKILVPAVLLSLEPAQLGLSDTTGPSWTERTIELLRIHGPGALAFLEALFRAADIRVSRSTTSPVEEQRP
jgi:CRISPR-associated endonuclease/helicase Cas3